MKRFGNKYRYQRKIQISCQMFHWIFVWKIIMFVFNGENYLSTKLVISKRQRIWIDAHIRIKEKKMIDWTMTACYLSLTRISLKVLTNNLLLYSTPIIIIIITKTANHHAFMLAFKTFIHFLEKTMVFSSFSHDLCD